MCVQWKRRPGDNVITGNNGNNTLDGGGGTDTLRGGHGDDVYIVDSTGDTVSESGGSGIDTIYSSTTRTLANGIENLVLTGTGNINGTGNSSANVITGNSGNNTLSGGADADTMIGGLGNDTYVIDNVGDVIVELAGEGTDTVQAAFSLVLSNYANVENLTLTGSGAVDATGDSSGANVLWREYAHGARW